MFVKQLCVRFLRYVNACNTLVKFYFSQRYVCGDHLLIKGICIRFNFISRLSSDGE